MGLFSKIKSMFQKNEELFEHEVVENDSDIEESENSDNEVFDEDVVNEQNDVIINESESEIGDVDAAVVENAAAVSETKDIRSNKSEKLEKSSLFGKKEKEQKSVKIYEKGLTKSRQGFVSKLASLTTKYNKVNDDYFEELEEILIMADIGVNTVMELIDRLRSRVGKENITNPEELKEVIVDELFITYVDEGVLSSKINYNEDGPTVILFVGVNGVGKTTTIGKLAWNLKNDGKKVLLVGADTFRAGAVSQLEEWSNKIGVGFYGKDQGSDPASVVFDGLVNAKADNYDVVLIDTAGRLQNKVNLMKELEKINKVIDGQVTGGASETLLVIDATTGQNGVSQANAFKEITNVTGIVLTKLDGTAKGGIVLAIKATVGIPVKYIGLGEAKEDLQVFDIEKYVYGLFKDLV